MVSRSFLFWVLLLLSVSAVGQETDFDRLYQKSRNLIGDNNELSMSYAFAALNEARINNNDFYKAKSYRLLGYLYKAKNDYSKALESYILSAHHTPVSQKTFKSEVYICIADIFRDVEMYDEFIEYSDGALSLVAHSPNYDQIANAYYYLSSGYRLKGDLDLSYHYNLKLRSILERVEDRSYHTLANNQAVIYFEKSNQMDSAFYMLENEPKIHNTTEARVLSLTNLGFLYIKQNDYDKALTVLKLALDEKDAYFQPEAYLYLSKCYYEKGEIENAKQYLSLALLNDVPLREIKEIEMPIGLPEFLTEKLVYDKMVLEEKIVFERQKVEVTEVLSRVKEILDVPFYKQWSFYFALLILLAISFFCYVILERASKLRKKAEIQDILMFAKAVRARMK